MKASEQGHAEAQSNLAFMYFSGLGVPHNYAEAVKWYRLAADQGDADAQFNLGVMYNNEEAPKDNPYIAYAWWRAAKENGHEQAKINLDILTAKMTKEQIAEAQSLSTEIYKRIEANKKE